MRKTRNNIPRLRDIKVGFNRVTVVHKDDEGFWNVRMPFALYPIRYTKWETAITFADNAVTAYSGSDLIEKSEASKIMINRTNPGT